MKDQREKKQTQTAQKNSDLDLWLPVVVSITQLADSNLLLVTCAIGHTLEAKKVNACVE